MANTSDTQQTDSELVSQLTIENAQLKQAIRGLVALRFARDTAAVDAEVEVARKLAG